MIVPRLRMVAGPNGSGKTTLVDYFRRVLAFPLGYCLNPDDLDYELAQTGHLDLRPWGIERDPADVLDFVRQHPLAHRAGAESLSAEQHWLFAISRVPSGYLASILSDYLRRYWLQIRASFTFETVMSSRDKLDLLVEARRAGYRTYLYYICTDAPVINQRRVSSRVQDGGHDVPADKIISRYERSLALLPEAIRLSDRAYLFDNSGLSHRLFAEFESGRLVRMDGGSPEWFQAART